MQSKRVSEAERREGRKQVTAQCDFRFHLFFSFSFVLVLQYFSVLVLVLPVIFNFSFVPEDVLMICLDTIHR